MSFAEMTALKLPDIPRWVEVRSYLRSEESEVVGYTEKPSLSFVLRIAEEDLLYIVGSPEDALIVDSAAALGDDGQLIAPQDQFARLAPLLPGWTAERIFVYSLSDTAHLPHDERVAVRFLDPDELSGADIDPELLEELEAALAYTPIAAAYVGGHPVSFCYASSETETLWDVGVDTVEAHQRNGYAGLCFSFLARQMAANGKTTVWQALESNPASWRLAEKLGMTRVDALAYFTRGVSS